MKWNFLKRSIPPLYAAQFVPSEFVPLVADSGNRFLQAAYSDATLSGFLQSAFNLAIVFAAILAVLRITYAGFLYMTSDIADNKNKAKSTIWNAILGLLLLLSLVLILEQINPTILNLNVDLENVQTPQGQSETTETQQNVFFSGAPEVDPDTAFITE